MHVEQMRTLGGLIFAPAPIAAVVLLDVNAAVHARTVGEFDIALGRDDLAADFAAIDLDAAVHRRHVTAHPGALAEFDAAVDRRSVALDRDIFADVHRSVDGAQFAKLGVAFDLDFAVHGLGTVGGYTAAHVHAAIDGAQRSVGFAGRGRDLIR